MKKRHHVVPKFLLERFALRGDVQLVGRDDFTKTLTTDTTNATVEKHFYTLDFEEGRSSELEDFFANIIEPRGASAIRRIVDEAHFPPPPGRRRDLATFLAFQYIRGPAIRAMLRDHYEAVAKKVASIMSPEAAREHLTEDGVAPSDEELEEILAFGRDTDGYQVRPNSEANLHASGTLNVALDLLPYFAKRSWLLVTFDHDALVTGDEPVALATDSGEPGERSLGLGGATQVFFTTDPRHAIAMIHPKRGAKERIVAGDAKLAALINRNVAYTCHRWIIHRPETEPLRGLSIPKKGPMVRTRGGLVSMHARPARAR